MSKKQANQGRQAVIYCRITSAMQNAASGGVGAQEALCRSYAENQGYRVDDAFTDIVASGNVMDRPGIGALLDHLDENQAETFAVVAVDPSRICRNPSGAVAFRKALQGRNADIEYVVAAGLARPEAEYVENTLAARSQFEDNIKDLEDV